MAFRDRHILIVTALDNPLAWLNQSQRGVKTSTPSKSLLKRVGFRIDRQGKHISMSKGAITAGIPRNNPVDAYTMAAIIRDAGMTVEEFKKLI